MRTFCVAFVLSICIFVVPSDVSAQIMCTTQYAPVCGAQEVQCVRAPCYPQYRTYGNACMANAANARILHEGECTPAESGPVKPEVEEPETYVPPARCTAWNDGCNSCARGQNGQTICTLKYCMNPGVGYCTAYETKPVPISDLGSATTTTATSSERGSPLFQPVMQNLWWQSFIESCARLFSWIPFWGK